MEGSGWLLPEVLHFYNQLIRRSYMPENLEQQVENIKKVTKEANKAIGDSIKDVDSVKGINGDGSEVISRTGKIYHIIPCALGDIPKLINLIKEIDSSITADKSPLEILAGEDNKMLKAMAKVISMSLKEEITAEEAEREFSLGTFPKVYRIALDMNDFLAGMRTIYQMQQ